MAPKFLHGSHCSFYVVGDHFDICVLIFLRVLPEEEASNTRMQWCIMKIFQHSNHFKLIAINQKCFPECVKRIIKMPGMNKFFIDNDMSFGVEIFRREIASCYQLKIHVFNKRWIDK